MGNGLIQLALTGAIALCVLVGQGGFGVFFAVILVLSLL